MQALMEIPLSVPPIHTRPFVISFDSGDECSLEHWFDVYRLFTEEEEEIIAVEVESDEDWT